MTHPIQPSVEDLLSLVGDAIVSTDEQGRVILFNRAAEEMFGVTGAEILNSPIEMLLPDRFHISHRQEVHDYAATASAPRIMGQKREVVGRRSDGSEFPVEATLCRRVIDESLILTVAIRDVTERKLLEEHRRLLNAELQHRMKNLIAVISSVVSLTARASGSVTSFRDAIQDRLLAVARSNDLMLAENTNKADLRSLFNSELAAYSQRAHDHGGLPGWRSRNTTQAGAPFVITLNRFRRIEALLREAGYGPIIEWSENIPKPANAEEFAREAAYVVVNSGFKYSVAAPIFERCMVALRAGRSAATEFGHQGKCQAIDDIWAERHALFAEYSSVEDKIAFLRTMPWIGVVTAWHLQKNLGGDHAKPDVHMERLARRDKTTTQKLCARLARKTNYRVASIDTVLWKACSENLLNSARYEAEGWKAAFRPEKFLARSG